jgi:hypothetical protein
MATPQENLARFQEIANRGLHDKLDPDKRARFDEAVKRGLVKAPTLSADPVLANVGSESAIQQQAAKRMQELQQEMAALEKARQDPSLLEEFFGAAEGVAATASGIVAAPIAGLSGLAGALNPFAPEGQGVANVQQTQEALTFKPRLRTGQQAIGELGEALAPVAEGLKETRETVGESALDVTGSPFIASLASTLPDATLSLLGLKQVTGAAKPLPGQTATQAAAQRQATQQLTGKVSPLQTPAKQKIAEAIAKGSNDADTAAFKLSSENLVSKITDGLPRVVKDKAAQAAINQGLDPATAAMIKGAGKLDNARFRQMLNIAKKSLKEAEFRALNNVGDIAGRSLLQRVRKVRDINKEAGQSIKRVANSELKGQTVNAGSATKAFFDELRKMDVKLTPELKFNFKGSNLEGAVKGAVSARNILNTTLSRLKRLKTEGNALDLHKLKRFIDTQVKFGKTEVGAAGEAEKALKVLRTSIDNVLDSNFPAYKKVNDVYSSTRNALDDFEKASGKTLNLLGKYADKGLAKKIRSLTSNNLSRANLLEAMDKIEKVALDNKAKISDSILQQVIFADEIESLLKIQPRTGLVKEIAKGVGSDVLTTPSATGVSTQAGLRAGRALIDKTTKTTPDKIIRSLEELLQEIK